MRCAMIMVMKERYKSSKIAYLRDYTRRHTTQSSTVILAANWKAGTQYKIGDKVSYEGVHSDYLRMERG